MIAKEVEVEAGGDRNNLSRGERNGGDIANVTLPQMALT